MDIDQQDKRFKKFKQNYSDEFLNEILDDLRIDKIEDKQAMKEKLFQAGQMYILRDNLRQMYIPKHEMKAKNEKMYKPLRSLKEKWKAFWQKDGFEYFKFYDYAYNKAMPFRLKRMKAHTNNQLILAYTRHDPRNYNDSYIELMEFLDFIDMSKEPYYENTVGGGIKGVAPIALWLQQLKPDWDKFTGVEMISGLNYGGTTGHNSDAVKILYKLMRRMHPDVGKNTISNTLERLIKNNWKKI